jgi:hypothetical protein
VIGKEGGGLGVHADRLATFRLGKPRHVWDVTVWPRTQ